MFVDNCGRDACGSRVFHPHGPGAVLVKRGAKDKVFAAVFSEGASTLWIVLDEVFHAERYKGSGVIVLWAVHVSVGGIFGV